MKIVCIARNYVAHAKELDNEVPSEPAFFLKPATAMFRTNSKFFIPDFTNQLEHEVEVVLRICKNGKFIPQKFASDFYDQIALGIDFTARDVQRTLKSKGLPWEKSKAFDNAASIGNFLPKTGFSDLKNLNFRLDKNDQTVQKGNTNLMVFDFDFLVSYVSKYITLNIGDLIYTGTPAGVGQVQPGDHLSGYIENTLNFELKIN